jgi:hypothetical protein
MPTVRANNIDFCYEVQSLHDAGVRPRHGTATASRVPSRLKSSPVPIRSRSAPRRQTSRSPADWQADFSRPKEGGGATRLLLERPFFPPGHVRP